MAIFGVLIGTINGFFGAGGGMLVVPILQFVFKKTAQTSHATAILIILPITLASAIVYIFNGTFDLGLTLSVGGGVVLGGIVGAILLGKLKPKVIGYVFSAIMMFAGIRVAFF